MLSNNLYSGLTGIGQKLPRVKGTAEAEKFPSMNNSEAVYLDDTAEDIIYIKVTDASGFSRTVRYRCIEEPEPTLQETLESQFASKQEINDLMIEIRELRKEFANAQHAQFNGSSKQGKSGQQQSAAG